MNQSNGKVGSESCRCSELKWGHTSETFVRRNGKVSVTVTGIPVQICQNCGESLSDLETFGEIERLVTPLLDFSTENHRLPPPRVTIEFPAVSAKVAA